MAAFLPSSANHHGHESLPVLKYSASHRQEIEDRTLYVKGVPKSMTEESLTKLFDPHAKVVSCQILRNDGRYPTNRAFLVMENAAHCICAIYGLNGKIVGFNDKLYVEFKDTSKYTDPSQQESLYTIPPYYSHAPFLTTDDPSAANIYGDASLEAAQANKTRNSQLEKSALWPAEDIDLQHIDHTITGFGMSSEHPRLTNMAAFLLGPPSQTYTSNTPVLIKERTDNSDYASMGSAQVNSSRNLKPEKPAHQQAEEIELQRIDHVSGEVFKEILVCFLDMFKDQHSEPRLGMSIVQAQSELCKRLVQSELPFPCETLETGSVPEKACTTTKTSSRGLDPNSYKALIFGTLTETEDYFVPEIDVMVVVDIETLFGKEHGYKLKAIETDCCFVTVSSNTVNYGIDPKMALITDKMTVQEWQNDRQSSFLSPKLFRLYMQEQLTEILVGKTIRSRSTNTGWAQYCEDHHRVSVVIEHGPAIQIRSTRQDEPYTVVDRPFSINEGERYSNEFDMDMVPAIKLPVWPEIAQAWIDRSRKWPSREEIQQIVSEGVLLVCKPPPNGNEMKDWRLSFSKAEKMLLSNSEQPCRQHAHRIFKYIIKHKLRPPRFISSYHCKTIVLWASERLPPNHWEWERLAHCVLGLLDDLLYSLSTRSCPHYFIPEVNLFHDIPADFLTTACKKLADIRRNPIIERPEMFESTAKWLVQDNDADFWCETTDEAMVCKLILQHKFCYTQEFIEQLKTDGDKYCYHGVTPPNPPNIIKSKKAAKGSRIGQ